MFKNLWQKIKDFFSIAIYVEVTNLEFRSKIPSYTNWIIPINFYNFKDIKKHCNY